MSTTSTYAASKLNSNTLNVMRYRHRIFVSNDDGWAKEWVTSFVTGNSILVKHREKGDKNG